MKFQNGDMVVYRTQLNPEMMMVIESLPLDGKVGVQWYGVDGKANNGHADESHLVLVEPIMQFFRYMHLPEHLRARSQPFADLADKLVRTYPRNPERTVALRKLLEAKDAAVRAALFE